MEAFGIALALIAGVVAAPVFCYALLKLVRPYKAIASVGFSAALAIVALFAVELLLVSVRGILATRALIGPVFFPLHELLTLGIAPACASGLLLGRRSMARWWPVAAAICWLVGAAAIFYQFDVAETLHGIDGIGGPYNYHVSRVETPGSCRSWPTATGQVQALTASGGRRPTPCDVDMGAIKGANTHLRSELVEAGTWVDLHISVMEEGSVEDARNVALQFLKDVVVTERQ